MNSIRFCDVIEPLQWEDVSLALQRFFPASKERLDRFEAAYCSLQALPPKESDMCILAVLDPDEPAVHVFGINGTPFAGQEGVPEAQRVPARFNLSATDWQEWLGMHVYEDYLQQFSASEIAAHCLWEMTYFGFSPEQIHRRITESLHQEQP
jgi:hypothetical protein